MEAWLQDHLDDELDRLFHCDLILEILFQNILGSLAVGTNGSGLPPTVVTTRITLVQLESICDVPACTVPHST